jgi:hypothetical protein
MVFNDVEKIKGIINLILGSKPKIGNNRKELLRTQTMGKLVLKATHTEV